MRLNETGNTRFLLPGIIFDKKMGEKRMIYDVYTKGSVVRVSDSDLGPIDMSLLLGKSRS